MIPLTSAIVFEGSTSTWNLLPFRVLTVSFMVSVTVALPGLVVLYMSSSLSSAVLCKCDGPVSCSKMVIAHVEFYVSSAPFHLLLDGRIIRLNDIIFSTRVLDSKNRQSSTTEAQSTSTMASSAPAVRTRITSLLKCRYPVVLPGMSWISTPELVAAVSNAGAHSVRGFVPYDETQDVLANSSSFVRACLSQVEWESWRLDH